MSFGLVAFHLSPPVRSQSKPQIFLTLSTYQRAQLRCSRFDFVPHLFLSSIQTPSASLVITKHAISTPASNTPGAHTFSWPWLTSINIQRIAGITWSSAARPACPKLTRCRLDAVTFLVQPLANITFRGVGTVPKYLWMHLHGPLSSNFTQHRSDTAIELELHSGLSGTSCLYIVIFTIHFPHLLPERAVLSFPPVPSLFFRATHRVLMASYSQLSIFCNLKTL
jgi:hypothetical protein